MELILRIAVVLVVILCGVYFLIAYRIKRLKALKPILGVVTPQKSQNAPESIKAVRKVK